MTYVETNGRDTWATNDDEVRDILVIASPPEAALE
jgi:hypothetical protein